MSGLVDIIVGYDCNLFCDYCTITPAMRERSLTSARIAAVLTSARAEGFDQVQFTGGEPTIRSDLLPLVRHAKSLGYADIKVQTNGLLLATVRNLERLLEAGVTTVHVSIHTHLRDEYERMVRREGVYDAMVAGLQNLVASEARVGADVILTTQTAPRLSSAVAWLGELGVRNVDLWFVSLTDHNATNLASMPKMSDAVPAIAAARDVAAEHAITLRSLHIPRCILGQHHDLAWDPGAARVKVVSPDATFNLADSPITPQLQVDACNDCRFKSRCPGLRRDYLARYGDGEVVAVP